MPASKLGLLCGAPRRDKVAWNPAIPVHNLRIQSGYLLLLEAQECALDECERTLFSSDSAVGHCSGCAGCSRAPAADAAALRIVRRESPHPPRSASPTP